MRIQQSQWTNEGGWKQNDAHETFSESQLVLVFGERSFIGVPERFQELRQRYPKAKIVFSSTAGEILDDQVFDGTIVVTALDFVSTGVEAVVLDISDAGKSFEVGAALIASLPTKGLVHTIVFSDGLLVNGSRLVEGILSKLPQGVAVTGGLSGDGTAFQQTSVGLDAVPSSGNVVLVGLYGERIRVGYGSLGGWDPFGPDRIITKSQGNVLYELDGEPALSLYKKYLGEKAAELPVSGLLFPLDVLVKNDDGSEARVVRTLLGVDEKTQSMTFAGDVPQGARAQLMKANFDRLIDGAGEAATLSLQKLAETSADFALLVSCVGRKLVLKDMIDDEIESVRAVIGKNAVITGFYSYGEICPTAASSHQCQLHNQTMTITVLREE